MKKPEKRRSDRIAENLDAEIISGGKTYKGIVMNFSEAGLYMVTATATSIVDITPSTLIELKCKLSSGKKIKLRCEVKWFQTKMSSHGVSFSMGMEILNPPKEYVSFVEEMI
ncbi:MAG: PilZ domain-containing protein [Nitrospirae bacterium]|nr:PilZ domain-containing protein [Nitrospirota bacterium]